jgi:hypothetical protein
MRQKVSALIAIPQMARVGRCDDASSNSAATNRLRLAPTWPNDVSMLLLDPLHKKYSELAVSPGRSKRIQISTLPRGILMDALDDYMTFAYEHGGCEQKVYRKGRRPVVLVMHEVPGISVEVARFAHKVANRGFTVFMPHLFGLVGEKRTNPDV